MHTAFRPSETPLQILVHSIPTSGWPSHPRTSTNTRNVISLAPFVPQVPEAYFKASALRYRTPNSTVAVTVPHRHSHDSHTSPTPAYTHLSKSQPEDRLLPSSLINTTPLPCEFLFQSSRLLGSPRKSEVPSRGPSAQIPEPYASEAFSQPRMPLKVFPSPYVSPAPSCVIFAG